MAVIRPLALPEKGAVPVGRVVHLSQAVVAVFVTETDQLLPAEVQCGIVLTAAWHPPSKLA